MITLLLLMAVGSGFTQDLQQQNLNELSEGTTLPSEQARKQIEQEMTAARRPSTRQAPDEDGTAQKETEAPIKGVNAVTAILLIGLTAIYAFSKKIKFYKTK